MKHPTFHWKDMARCGLILFTLESKFTSFEFNGLLLSRDGNLKLFAFFQLQISSKLFSFKCFHEKLAHWRQLAIQEHTNLCHVLPSFLPCHFLNCYSVALTNPLPTVFSQMFADLAIFRLSNSLAGGRENFIPFLPFHTGSTHPHRHIHHTPTL